MNDQRQFLSANASSKPRLSAEELANLSTLLDCRELQRQGTFDPFMVFHASVTRLHRPSPLEHARNLPIANVAHEQVQTVGIAWPLGH